MVEPNNAFQLTSNYISTTSRSEMVAAVAGGSAPPSPSISPSIDSFAHSFTHVIPAELYGVPSDSSSNLLTSTDHDHEASEDNFNPPKYQPILKWNALCVQALLYPIAVFVYLLIGAAIFTAIEYDHEEMAKHVQCCC